MTDSHSLIEFLALDEELKSEFFADITDCMRDINECGEMLESDAEALINRFFRSIHTVKGNCNMVFLEPFVAVTHQIEEMVQEIRNGEYSFEPAFGRLFVTGMNAVHESIAQSMESGEYDHRFLDAINRLFLHVRQSEQGRRVEEAMRAELAIIDGHYSLDLVAVSQLEGEAFSIFEATDMEFFHYLSECQQVVESHHTTRMAIQIQLAKELNQALDDAVDEDQLLAALYVFEFFRVVKGNDQDQVRRRVFSGGSMLARIPGWDIAATLVFQSFEQLSGQGFPKGLTESDILPAAKVIHLCDVFVSEAMDSINDGYKSSLFKAVKAVNGLQGSHYSEPLIRSFNRIVKERFLQHQAW